jgi:hypothetical protein
MRQRRHGDVAAGLSARRRLAAAPGRARPVSGSKSDAEGFAGGIFLTGIVRPNPLCRPERLRRVTIDPTAPRSLTMKRTVVRYRTKPDSTEENARLIAGVFGELEARAPDGVRYLVLKLDDGSFIHFVTAETDAGTSPLTALEAFRRFQSGVRDRCAEPPQSAAATVVGSYRVLG